MKEKIAELAYKVKRKQYNQREEQPLEKIYIPNYKEAVSF